MTIRDGIDRCHKKAYYDLESIQIKLSLTQDEINKAWEGREPETPVFLKTIDGVDFYISNYSPLP